LKSKRCFKEKATASACVLLTVRFSKTPRADPQGSRIGIVLAYLWWHVCTHTQS